MPFFPSKVFIGALVLSSLAALPLRAQSPLTLTIEDSGGAALPGVSVSGSSGRLLGHTDSSGRISFPCGDPCPVRVTADAFQAREVDAARVQTLRLQPAAASEQVTVTAYRAPLGELQSPVTTRLLTQSALQSSAAVSMDSKLRQLPGVELFRRSSSLVANPTSQGISLRGLGSTAASRTLVTVDDVPLNDPLGGWIHWDEEPELAIQNIEVVRGGASDLYGSSAIGGVINLHLAQPHTNSVELRSSYGGQGTYEDALLAQAKHGPWAVLTSGGVLGTDGYIQEAPWQRGPVDTASNVHSHNGLLLLDRNRGPLRVIVRASEFHEARANGTPYQHNSTRLWRYATGGDWQGPRGRSASLRLFGSTETYRQTFSSLSNLPVFGDPDCSYRCGETPTRSVQIPDNELGAAAHWSQPFGPGLLLVTGADVRDVRVWDREQTFSGAGALTQTDVHQRDSGAYGELMWVHRAWTISGSGRMDWFQNYDARQRTLTSAGWTLNATQPPQFDQNVFNPRLGVSRKFLQHWAISASGFRAFRAPTPSELYRNTQVGSKLTLANGSLLSERATGWETGVASERNWGTIRASYFLTQVNRPITAVTLKPNAATILLKRENLGQIESRGVSIDFELAPRRWLAVDGGYQYAHATVTRGSQDLGNWIPEVARNMATLNLRAFQSRVGTLSLQSRLSGRQFDDDANLDMLHGYFRLDAYGSHEFGKRLEFFAAAENLFDRDIEVAKTPTTTLDSPRVARAGLNIRVGAIDR